MSRVLIVSNRLPITLRVSDDGFSVERSSGGLATGLKPVHEAGGGLWIGWPGSRRAVPEASQALLDERFAALQVVPVALSDEEVEQYYEGYCNGVLWPLFHSFPSQLPLESADFALYRDVNARFAREVARHHRPGDVVWIHDYQLMLVPRMLRDLIPDVTVGFFLHIPFPSPDTFRTLPSREALLEGLLASDLIGFHTASYVRNFVSSALHVLGADSDVDHIRWQGRVANLGVFPMGVDAPGYQRLAESPEVAALVAEFRGAPGERMLVGIDRLDYTKGIPRRLLAYERMLAEHPELHGQVRLVQVAVPSRTNVDAYAELRQQVDGLIGRINGRFGSPRWAPVHYLYRSLSEQHVVALYRAADALLVTPIRDGMNLVAKEFIAARSDEDGVLVLSEFAGAAAELAEALKVNPYDIERSAAAYHRALVMPAAERRARMQTLRHRVFSYDVRWWSRTFLENLARSGRRTDHRPPGYSDAADVAHAAGAMTAARAAGALVLLLDYDGTLVPIAATPELAQPDDALRALLARLAACPGVAVHVVSGRGRDVLEGWLGGLPVGLHAEHGQWSRAPGGSWVGLEMPPDHWRGRALEILEDFAARTPGSLVERKRSGVAWHYRMADPEYGLLQANELKVHLASLLSNAPVEVLSGDKVVELRPYGVNKGRVVSAVLAGVPEGAVVAAFGDDRTDEDLFAALPPDALSFHVGIAPSRARLRLASVDDVRALLAGVCP
ncbi:MAG: bifunctional alpha,alpha-trehalose-phosphate synthase (UDP-forming)/trehalose-phosphatase [Deltaproteobacteria bacterium]|nr:bifunctional alpha,alpha-trehalose-phosphate synthase (UDP-forming)/trehalose-phosphatase [Myxococcales bacterium]MDP3212717.1 bifunctional alpha,alpha-trehalose-phosphate synthase (UDP-forming)/trehalose-phosphatase [Deltaproteobacteria bacterium]